MGDHTDYLGGLVLPVATPMGTTVTGRRVEDRIVLESAGVGGRVDLSLPSGGRTVPGEVVDPPPPEEAGSDLPTWGRFVVAVVEEVFDGSPPHGIEGGITSDLPIGAGLSSSASLEVALALALGWRGSPLDLASRCRRAETSAVGVPCGIMDQVAVTAARAGHALLLDCATTTWDHVEVPADLEIVVVDSGQARRLEGSEYADRRHQAEEAARRILGADVDPGGGPFRGLAPEDAGSAGDPLLVARARHHIGENSRVESMAAALSAGDLAAAGHLMSESHLSLARDYEVSTPTLDRLVRDLGDIPGVYGARLTGAGFGGCVVAIARRGAVDPADFHRAWVVVPSAGALG